MCIVFDLLFGPGTGVLGFASYDTFDANGFPIEGVSFLNGGSILGGFPEDDFFGVQVHYPNPTTFLSLVFIWVSSFYITTLS